jgi:predicted ArsR family transcriptional regulator
MINITLIDKPRCICYNFAYVLVLCGWVSEMNTAIRDTRWDILQHLRESGQASAQELSKALGMSPVSIHYHLNVLQREGLVEPQPVRRSVGRPHYVYSLRDSARELFPQSYHRLADRLLDELKSRLTEQQVSELFARIANDIAAEYIPALEGKTLDQKIQVLIALLGEEGFLARVEKVGGQFRLTQYGCPYYYVVERHPEVCELDLSLISATLLTPVEREGCVLRGDDVCTFIVSPESKERMEKR